jgi:hypothetical protein
MPATAAAPAPVYIFDSKCKPSLPLHRVPLIEASDESLEGFGYLVDDPDACDIEIVRWPAQGWRPVDEDSGNEGGLAEGIFEGYWQGDELRGVNEAVGGDYVLGWSRDPQQVSSAAASAPREQVLLWHMNYHPDGGQLFFPLDPTPFVLPLALPGDNLTLRKIKAFWCDGTRGVYIHPNIWHEGIFPVADRQRFLDRQGKVHARVSCNIGEEFGVYLSVPLTL